MNVKNENQFDFIKKIRNYKYFNLIIAVIPILFLFFLAINSKVGKAAFVVDTVNVALLFFVAALSLDLEVGSIGLPNFGKVGFIALGAYMTAIMYYNGLSIFAVIIITILVSGFFGFLIAIPTVKLRADYFAIMAISGGELIRLMLQFERRYFWIKDSTGVPQQDLLSPIKNEFINLNILGVNFSDSLDLNLGQLNLGIFNFDLNFGNVNVSSFMIMMLFIILSIIIYLFVEQIRKSPYGRTLRAIREDDISVTSVGKDVYRFRWQITVISAMICGFSGSMWTLLYSAMEGVDFQPFLTFQLFVFIIIGGIGNSRGVFVGTFLVNIFLLSAQTEGVKQFVNIHIGAGDTIFDEILENFQLSFIANADNSRQLILGIILILFLLYLPNGLVPEPRSNNERYLSLLKADERASSDKAVFLRQSATEQERIKVENLNGEN